MQEAQRALMELQQIRSSLLALEKSAQSDGASAGFAADRAAASFRIDSLSGRALELVENVVASDYLADRLRGASTAYSVAQMVEVVDLAIESLRARLRLDATEDSAEPYLASLVSRALWRSRDVRALLVLFLVLFGFAFALLTWGTINVFSRADDAAAIVVEVERNLQRVKNLVDEVQAQNGQLGERIDVFHRDFGQLEQRLGGLGNKIRNLEAEAESRLATFDQYIGKLELNAGTEQEKAVASFKQAPSLVYALGQQQLQPVEEHINMLSERIRQLGEQVTELDQARGLVDGQVRTLQAEVDGKAALFLQYVGDVQGQVKSEHDNAVASLREVPSLVQTLTREQLQPAIDAQVDGLATDVQKFDSAVEAHSAAMAQHRTAFVAKAEQLEQGLVELRQQIPVRLDAAFEQVQNRLQLEVDQWMSGIGQQVAPVQERLRQVARTTTEMEELGFRASARFGSMEEQVEAIENLRDDLQYIQANVEPVRAVIGDLSAKRSSAVERVSEAMALTPESIGDSFIRVRDTNRWLTATMIFCGVIFGVALVLLVILGAHLRGHGAAKLGT